MIKRSAILLFLVTTLLLAITNCRTDGQVPQAGNPWTCDACKRVEKTIGYLGETGVAIALLDKAMTCKILLKVTKMSIISQADCEHLIGQMRRVPAVVIRQLLLKHSGYLCYLMAKVCPASEVTLHWFDSDKYVKEIMDEPKAQKESETAREETKEPVKILHFSDSHIKLRYKEGASADGSKYKFGACEHDPTSESESLAKKFGNPACDMPTLTFEAFLTESAKVQPDIIIYTGDNNDHNLQHYTNNDKFAETSYIANRLRDTFPNASVMITPGNIETAPQDHQFDHLEGSLDWALKGLAKAYAPLLSASEQSSLQTRGYFSRELPQFNIRVISLFSALYDPINFFQIARTFDPMGIFDFLRSELRIAEGKGQKVLFLSHAPASEGMHAQFSKVFQAIMVRYKDTVIAQFAGHNHQDTIEFYEDSQEQGRALAPVFAVASLTPLGHGTPSFRVWQYDAGLGLLLDYDQYKFDLQRANKLNDSSDCWSKYYSFNSAFRIEGGGLTLTAVDNLRRRLQANTDQVLEVYASLRNRFSVEPLPLSQEAKVRLTCILHADIRQVALCLKIAGQTLGGISSKLALLYDDYITFD